MRTSPGVPRILGWRGKTPCPAHTIVLPIVETAAGAPTAGVGTLHLGYRRTILRFSGRGCMSAPIGRLPLGVAILAVLIGIFGFFIFLLGLLVIVAGIGFGLAGASSVFGYTGAVAGVIILIIGLVILGVAVGLWNQELWALVLAILVLLFYAVITFISASWLAFVIVVLLLVYMVAVSSHFD